MTQDKITNVVDGVFVFLLTVCPLQCVASSFGININLGIVVIFTAMFSMIFSLLAVLEKSKLKYVVWNCMIIAVFCLMVLLSKKTLMAQLNYVINNVLWKYSEYLPVVDKITLTSKVAEGSTGLFIALGVIISGLLTFFIVRLKRNLPASAIAIVTVAPCFVLVNTLPNIIPLLTMFAVLFTLFVSGAVHRTNTAHSGIVSSVVAVAMAVLVTVVYLFNPVKDYERSKWQDDLLAFTSNITGVNSYDGEEDEKLSSALKFIRQQIDLSNAGPKEKNHQRVMTVISPYSGKLYLKGVAYANYQDNVWSILSDEQAESYPVGYSSSVMTKSSVVEDATININTRNNESVIYTPYYLSSVPVFGTELCDVLIRNDNDTQKYNINFQEFKVEFYSSMGNIMSGVYESPYTFSYEDSEQYAEYKDFVYQNYLSVPEEIKTEMLRHAEENGFIYLSKAEILDAVKSYVRQSAEYSLNTPRVPEGKEISTWLLNESDTGYCVHFATTSAVMLRSLGIPTRYVTGYCVESNPDDMTFVTSDNAHAWVEYFDDHIGWVPFDATPPDFTSFVELIAPTETATNQPPIPTQSPTAPQYATIIHQSSPTQSTANPQQTGQTQATASASTSITKSVPVAVKVIIIIVIVALLLITTLIIRRKVVLLLRKQSFEKSNRNNRARCIYRYILKTSKYSHIPIPEQVLTIAEKSRFSNDRVDPSELDIMLETAKDREKELLEDTTFIKRIYFKYILVLV